MFDKKKMDIVKEQLSYINAMGEIPSKYISKIDSARLYIVRPTSIYGSAPKRKKASAFSTRFR